MRSHALAYDIAPDAVRFWFRYWAPRHPVRKRSGVACVFSGRRHWRRIFCGWGAPLPTPELSREGAGRWCPRRESEVPSRSGRSEPITEGAFVAFTVRHIGVPVNQYRPVYSGTGSRTETAVKGSDGGVECFAAVSSKIFRAFLTRFFYTRSLPLRFFVQVTVGATEGLFVSLKTLAGPGDEVSYRPRLEPLRGRPPS